MKNLKKNTLKILVLVALLCPAAFADGDMGGGGFVGCEDPAHPGTIIECPEGDMGGGGRSKGDMGGGGRMSTSGYLDTAYIFFDSIIREIL